MSETARRPKPRKALIPTPSAPVVVRRRRRPRARRHPVLVGVLGGLFAVEFAVLAVAPHDRTTWLIENALVALLLLAWTASSRRIAPSRSSIVLVFGFLAIHEVGAHYTYSEVPYEAWLAALGLPSPAEVFAFERNHFDRAVHFLFGLMLAPPIRDVLMQTTHVRGRASYLIPVAIVVGLSVAYEGIELGYGWFAGDASANFLGQQGDAWDGVKDMALASAGAVLATALALWLGRRPAQALPQFAPRSTR